MSEIVLFGNGIGRSIDDNFYSLSRVLEASWRDDQVVSAENKRLITSCLRADVLERDEGTAPTSEEELADLQRVLNACEAILEFEAEDGVEDVFWLSEYGRKFPAAIRRYFHHAASQFHSNDKRLPEAFAAPLRTHILKGGVSVATLNYDDLLYEAFTGTEVFDDHVLRDGFLGGPFDFQKHEGWFKPATEGWFLHLHGSPLFVDKDGKPRKIKRSALSAFRGDSSVHLVLTNADYKPGVIANSEILRAYWQKFEQLLQEAKKITVLGYGGGDLHLNSLLARTRDAQTIRIIARQGQDDASAIAQKWAERFLPREAGHLQVVLLEDVMDFTDW